MSKLDATGKTVIVIGGLLVDDIAISKEILRAGSSNPVQWQHRLGGVATNVARVVAQQIDTLLIASTGDDNHGKLIASLLSEASLSSSLVVRVNQNSDRYTAVLDHDGELYIGLADAQLAEQLNWSDIDSRLPDQAPAAIVIDANLSERCLCETINALRQRYSSKVPVIALAVSPVKALRMLSVASAIDTLICNRREAAALSGLDTQSDVNTLADALVTNRFHRFVITDGSQPILVHDQHAREAIPVPPTAITQNVNGAGDALAGSTIAQLVTGEELAVAVATAGIDAARSVLTGHTSPPAL